MADASTCRLLVADDNADNRDVLSRRLRRLGHARIDAAENGVVAVRAIREAQKAGQPYDAVLLDVMMPEMNGIEVLEALAGDPALRQTPVIMISAATDIETVVRCIELGAEDYLPKPFNPVLLRARLGNLLEKKRLRDEVGRQLGRMEAELADARRQQLSMVPHEFPPPDPAHPYAVHAVMQPAREIGGDLYDCFVVAPGTLCVAVGDVSDKGVPAALFMARTRSLLRACALQFAASAAGRPPSPSEVAGVLNEELCKNNPEGMFVTLLLGILDCAEGRLSFVNAGHLRPWRLPRSGPVTEVATQPEPPLGVLPGLRHTSHSILLAPEEAIVLLTDGLADTTDTEDRFYGQSRVAADLDALRHEAPAGITAALVARVRDFAMGAPPADDLTVLALRRLRPGIQPAGELGVDLAQ